MDVRAANVAERGLSGTHDVRVSQPPAGATERHEDRPRPAPRRRRPALEIAPPVVFWPKQEIAIDAFPPRGLRGRDRPGVRADRPLPYDRAMSDGVAIAGSVATVRSVAVAGSVATAHSVAVAGSAATAASAGVAGSAATVASAAVAGSAATAASVAIAGSAATLFGVALVACAATVACVRCSRCAACVACVDCTDCVGCVGCVGLRGESGRVGVRRR